MISGTIFNRKKSSWPPEEYVSRATLQLLDYDSAAPPRQAWRRRLNSHANILKEFSITFKEAFKMVQLGIRLWSYVRKEASHGRRAPIDPFTKEATRPSASQGVPLGGMGSGSISRGFRGEFRLWQIIPGISEASPVIPNQFSIFISRDAGAKRYESVLSPGQHEGLGKFMDGGISSWGWNLSGQHSSYHALFPRAWTIYDGEPDPDLKVSCRQISPFIPHNYRDSSLPTAVFVYTLVNTGKERARVSLLLTWANSIGGISHQSGDHVKMEFLVFFCVTSKTAKNNPPVTFAVAACETQNVNVTVFPSFGLFEGSYPTAEDMWNKMTQDGEFDRENFNAGTSARSCPGETLCCAVSASTWVEPQGKSTIAFAVSWSSPKIKFSKGSSYFRRYTKYFGTSERAAEDLAHYALTHYRIWEEEIEKWQRPVLEDQRLPEWYKFTLFNELYFLVAGGTIWIDYPLQTENCKSNSAGIKPSENRTVNLAVAKANEQSHISEGKAAVQSNSYSSIPSEDESNVGRFLYLEGVEYIMWCTYDVHFYASFALLALFPKIELNIQREFAKAVLSEDHRKVKYLAEGNWGIRKVKGAVPHDLGTHDPWNEMNAYNIHDTSKWKDLNPKFVLQVYRDFAATQDTSFGVQVWPSVRAAVEYMEQFDRDNDGLIENDGFPDQTYDTWKVHGISAYCGCLWIAALQAAASMAYQLGETEFAEKCKSRFLKAKFAFESKLWNGSYFNYDSGLSINSRSIQADQLAGQWYTASSGLPNLFDNYKIRTALQRIFNFNVMKIRGGGIGAVNGMHPNGRVDETCMQSREIWSGVTYALAANMILAGMEDQAFVTAEGIFSAGWSEDGYGYWFQTPEAWTIDGHFRSLIYMRPLAIWGMQWALMKPREFLRGPLLNIMDRIDVSTWSSRSSRTEGANGVNKKGKKGKCFGNSIFHCAC
ncbi:hypothetical protein V2J09_024105 [Rumex salicifolius]